MSGYAIALMNRPETEAELEKLGFEKRTVYVKYIDTHDPVKARREGEAIFFGMKYPPRQFYGCTDSWWGEGDL